MSDGGTVADRLALRELVESYASYADAADGAALAALFTEDGALVTQLTPAAEPAARRGRAEIAAAIGTLTRYRATMHVIASHRSQVDGDTAEGHTRCVAHHVTGEGAETRDRVMYIHYTDRYARVDGRWLIAERTLRPALVEERSLVELS